MAVASQCRQTIDTRLHGENLQEVTDYLAFHRTMMYDVL